MHCYKPYGTSLVKKFDPGYPAATDLL